MKSIIKDWYTGENIPVEAACRLRTNSARWRGKRKEELKAGSPPLSQGQNRLYEALCDREEFAGLHRATAIFAQGVGSGLRLAFEALG